jgi:tellurite resistance protein
MIGAITKYFNKRIASATESGDTTKHRLQVATAAMLIEMARADFAVHPEEIEQVTQAVQTTFGLSQTDAEELIRLAEEEAKQATDYYQFTSLINKGFSQEEKIRERSRKPRAAGLSVRSLTEKLDVASSCERHQPNEESVCLLNRPTMRAQCSDVRTNPDLLVHLAISLSPQTNKSHQPRCRIGR